MRVLTFSTKFPIYHPKAGQPTVFVEKIWKGFMDDEFGLPKEFHEHIDRYTRHLNEIKPIDLLKSYLSVRPKFHTVRAGKRWNVGDRFSPRIWSEKSYRSPQIIFAPPIEVKKVWDITFHGNGLIQIGDRMFSEHKRLALNDGLEFEDFNAWFPQGKLFEGQIICWNDKIEY